jgi:macrodomain Ter protein organizer (MatP/YcbG family)
MENEILCDDSSNVLNQTMRNKRKKMDENQGPEQNSQNHDIDNFQVTENLPNFYNLDDEGPYRVHVEFIKSDDSREITNLLVAQVLMSRLKIQNIGDVKKFGKKTVTVYFSNSLSANILASSGTARELEEFNLKAYIPGSYLFVSGVLRNVDMVDLEDLELQLKGPFKVQKLTRLTRYDRETDTKMDTKSVKITFRANKLPDSVYAYNTKIHVSPFLAKIKQCKRCLRYGHFQDQCKSKFERCSDCGANSHADGSAQCTVKCIYCKKNHSAFDPNCEERQRQRNVKFLMAKNNISYFEALELHPTYTKNSFSLLENLDEFPDMPPVRKTYAKTTTASPRTRATKIDKPKTIWSSKKLIENKPRPAADQEPDPLAGPAYNYENPHKTTELEKFWSEINVVKGVATSTQGSSISNTPSSPISNTFEKFMNPAQKVVIEKIPTSEMVGIEYGPELIVN